LSEETKEKISKSNTGKKRKPFSEETKQKMKESAKLRNIKPPSRLGMKHNQETKLKMKNVSLGTSKNNYIDPRIIFSFKRSDCRLPRHRN
jgi:hypothetical protein